MTLKGAINEQTAVESAQFMRNVMVETNDEGIKNKLLEVLRDHFSEITFAKV